MARRLPRILGRTALVLLLAAGTIHTSPSAAAGPCSSAFDPSFAADLARRYPGIKVTAAVYDVQTGCWHHLNQGMQITTASVIKAQVLGAVLLRAQDQARALTAWERSQIAPMISYSFNPETSALYQHVGSAAGMHATDPRFGATATTHTATFGLTRSTAVDRTLVALRLLHGGGDLRQAGRDQAWAYMTHVHPLQQWGITAGVPAGWTVAQKNGFYPSSGIGWRVGSSGFVRRDDADQGYAITVMTEGGGDQATGMRLVEDVSRGAAAVLTVGPGVPRPIDRARCVRTSSGESWAGVAGRLGLPADRAGDVRTVAGGNPSPLGGQQPCSPDVPAEQRAVTSTVNRRYRTVATDLDCDGRDDLVWYAPGAEPDFQWQGQPGRGFRQRSLTITGDLIPVDGDFDGDGCGDVLWYGPGTRPDTVWYGGTTVSSRPITVLGLGYSPEAGDFDGDGRDDVLWYGPGGVQDSIWFGTARRATFSRVATNVAGAYEPLVGDLDGDGADDVLWYAPGTAPDPYWSGTVGQRGTFTRSTAIVDGRFRPVTGDLDGDGADEVVWHGPATAPDVRWDGVPSRHTSTSLVVGGDHLPVTGDFDGDGRDDIAWYGPAGAGDALWWSEPDGAATSRPLVAT
jgi:beta-lactamase class A